MLQEGGCCDFPTAEELSTVFHWQTYCPSALLQDNATKVGLHAHTATTCKKTPHPILLGIKYTSTQTQHESSPASACVYWALMLGSLRMREKEGEVW